MAAAAMVVVEGGVKAEETVVAMWGMVAARVAVEMEVVGLAAVMAEGMAGVTVGMAVAVTVAVETVGVAKVEAEMEVAE